MSKRMLYLVTIGLILPFLWIACGGGGSLAGGGIGGSGAQDTSTGVVTAVGSITVNGIKFETDDAEVTKEDETLPHDRLAVGMVVEVRGKINDNQFSGSAAQVEVFTAVRGRIEDIMITENQMTVLGQTVLVKDNTIFDATIAPPSLAGLSVGDRVEVSGLVTDNSMIRATRIEKLLSGSDINVKIAGFVFLSTATTFKINTVLVDYSSATLIGFDDTGPFDGDYVEVAGTLNGLTLNARSVKRKGGALNLEGEVEVEGFITAANSPDFTLVSALGPVTFQITDATEFEDGNASGLLVGAKIEIEGYLIDNVLQAEKIFFDHTRR